MSLTFLLTSLVIVATPGTGALYTLAAGLTRGARASVLAAFACTLGTVPHLVAAITGLAALERADRQSRTAIETARLVLELATARYEGGATTYLDVITAQQSLLAAERLGAQLSGQRLLTSVFLIKALGGDWERPARLANG